MTTFIPWWHTVASQHIAHSVVLALGWTLVHFCWQGAVVAAALGIVLGAVGTQRSQARYVAACFALALLVALPLVTFVHLASEEMAQRAVAHGVLTFDVAAMPDGGGGGAHIAVKTLLRKTLTRAVPWLPAAWLLGVLLFLARLAFGLAIARRMRSNTTELVETELRAMFGGLIQRLEIRRTVMLLRSAMVQVPTVVGWLQPVVLLPVCCFTGLSSQQIEALLAHELAHVRRHDYLVSVAQSVIEALLFYHPAVWWVSQQVRRERECCCDAIAAEICGDTLQYARALSQLEERRAGMQQIVIAANGGVLTMRIKRLLGYTESAVVSPVAVVALTVALIASMGVYFAGTACAEVRTAVAKGGLIALIETPVLSSAELQPLPAVPAPKLMAGAAEGPFPVRVIVPGMDVTASPMTGYGTWLNRDVLWIISPEERAAFLKLNSDVERDQFIQSFWDRREQMNGRAGSKDEHYARIAYANEHFAGNQPGWMTDRGHVYIVLGKPESIDSHPSGESSAGGVSRFPFEVWNYRHVEGMGDNIGLRFVDACQCGDYKLQLGQGGSFSAGLSPMPTHGMQIAAGAMRVSAGVMADAVVARTNPVYPAIAKAAHVQGVVVLHALIGKTGEMKELQVVSGPPMLIGSAMDAVRQWKYRPYLVNGEPTEVETTINVNFSFGDSAPQTTPDGVAKPVSTSGDDHTGGMATTGAVSSRVSSAKFAIPDDGATRPVLFFAAPPEYTAEALNAKFVGVVTVGMTVDESGLPKDVHVIRGIGMGLDEKALEAVRKYRFKPAMKNGQPVEKPLNVEVDFQIAS